MELLLQEERSCFFKIHSDNHYTNQPDGLEATFLAKSPAPWYIMQVDQSVRWQSMTHHSHVARIPKQNHKATKPLLDPKNISFDAESSTPEENNTPVTTIRCCRAQKILQDGPFSCSFHDFPLCGVIGTDLDSSRTTPPALLPLIVFR
jgi:hypothetical protein